MFMQTEHALFGLVAILLMIHILVYSNSSWRGIDQSTQTLDIAENAADESNEHLEDQTAYVHVSAVDDRLHDAAANA